MGMNMFLLPVGVFVFFAFHAEVSASLRAASGKPCECGRENVGGRIIGGTPADANRYPWMVGIMAPQSNGGMNICGGTLINERYILTAAHCVLSERIMEANVVLGGHFRDDVFGSALSRPIAGVHVHKEYNKNGKSQHDIALIRLKDRVEFTRTVSPICLGGDINTDSLAGNLFASGWGLTESNDLGEQLNEVQLPVVSDAKCEAHSPGQIYARGQFCAGAQGTSTGVGDSGGPLSTRDGGHVYQVGIVSYSFHSSNTRQHIHSVYTRVSGYIDWIKNMTRDAEYCI